MTLMERIKCTSFLDMSLADQSALVRSIQLIRSKSLKEASKKKVRKTAKKAATAKKATTPKKKKAVAKKITNHIADLDQASLLELAAKHGIKL